MFLQKQVGSAETMMATTAEKSMKCRCLAIGHRRRLVQWPPCIICRSST